MKTLFLIQRVTLFAAALSITEMTAFAKTSKTKLKTTDIPLVSAISIKPTEELKNSSFFNLGLHQDSSERSTRYSGDFQINSKNAQAPHSARILGGYYPQSQMAYAALPEAYVSWNTALETNSRFNVAFGRRKMTDNFLDSQYNLGVINPYFSLDRINYITQGQTGLHSSVKIDHLTIGGTYSPLHLPNQGPVTEVKDGQIKGATPWTQAVPQTFIFNNKENKIYYTLKEFDTKKLIFNEGYSGFFQLGNTGHNDLQLTGQYSHSPMNDIVIGRTVIADLNLNGNVDIYPVIRYSNKIATDLEYNFLNWKYKLSYIKETPENKLESDDKAVQTFGTTEGVGIGAEAELPEIATVQATLEFGYAHFYGGEIKDLNDDGTQNTFNLSESRLLFKQPINFGLKINNLVLFNQPLLVKTNWLYDLQQQGSLFSLNAKHNSFKDFYLGIGFDLIGTTKDDEENKKNFLSKHKSNDRINGSLEYVF